MDIKINLINIVLAFGILTTSCIGEVNKEPNILPAVQSWQGGKGFVKINEKSKVITNADLKGFANNYIERLSEVSGLNLKTGTKGSEGTGNIKFEIVKVDSLNKEGYIITIGDNVLIRANTEKGLSNGAQTLTQMMAQGDIPKGKIVDYPLVSERAFMMDAGRKFFSVDYVKKTIREMSNYKLNYLHLHFTDWSGFRLKSDKFPGLASDEAYSKEDIRYLQDYAKKYNVEIIPEIDLPAHATEILRYDPSLGFSCESMLTAKWLPDSVNKEKVGWILDVTRPKTREFIHELLTEFIPLFDSKYFHIGGDEWQFDNQKDACEDLVRYAKKRGFKHTGDVFVDWVNETNKLVKSYGKTTHIWSWWGYTHNGQLSNETELKPDEDIIVNVWNENRYYEVLEEGYNIIATPETGVGALYITPGDKGVKPGDYGYFDSKGIYEDWQPDFENQQINGYKVCLWADRVEHKHESWFDQYTELPLAVFSEKMWTGKSKGSLDDFLIRKKQVDLK